MEKASDFRLVFVACEMYDNAIQIARILVTEKLAACCSVTNNTTSVFGWHGAIHERRETIIMIKTSADQLNQMESRIKELHTDEVPEIISITLESCSHSYLEWMKQVCQFPE